MLLPSVPAVDCAHESIFYMSWMALLPASPPTGNIDNSNLPTLYTIPAILRINKNA